MKQSLLQSTTFCLGFWPIKDNAKRSLSHYLSTLPQTCRMVSGGRMVLFYDGRDVLDFVGRCTAHFNVQLHPVRIPISDLPAAHFADRLVEGCARTNVEALRELPISWREKGLVHVERDYQRSGAEAYRKILSVWMSKIALIAERAASDNPFQTSSFAWIDASVARFNGRREHWNFVKASEPGDQLMHYANRMRFLGSTLPVNASCMIGSRELWRRLNIRFAEELRAHADDDYPHDEETILHFVQKAEPGMFKTIGQNYTGRRENWGKRPHAVIRRYDAWRVG